MAKFTSTGHLAEEIAFIVSAAGVTSLAPTAASTQIVTGTLTETVKTPLATNLVVGTNLSIINRSTQLVTVQLFTGTAGIDVDPETGVRARLTSNGTSDGTWDFDVGGASALIAGGIETEELLTVSPHTVPVGSVHFHPFLEVSFGDTLIIDGKLLTADDTILGTVQINPGAIWKVL